MRPSEVVKSYENLVDLLEAFPNEEACIRETLEKPLCPSPGFLKSLAVTGESESYVDPI